MMILGSFSSFALELKDGLYSDTQDISHVLMGYLTNVKDRSCVDIILDGKLNKVNISMGSRIVSLNIYSEKLFNINKFHIEPIFDVNYVGANIGVCIQK